MVTAIVLVKADIQRIPEVAEMIAQIAGVSEVYSVTGEFDLVAMVRVRGHDELADVIPGRLQQGAGHHAHRDAHRVPRLLTARPGGRVLPGRRRHRLAQLARPPPPQVPRQPQARSALRPEDRRPRS